MSAPLRVAVAGARGRLGRLVCDAVRQAPDLSLALTLTRGDDARAALSSTPTDVLVDVSLPEASRALVPLAAGLGVAPVVGTSGLTPSDLEAFRRACERAGVCGLVVPNFSLGAVLQMECARRVAAHMDCERLTEIHHPAKRDAPSGTSLATATLIAEATGGDPPAIRSERVDGVVARQELVFGAAGERLELIHEVVDRRAYLPGVLLAVRRVRALPGLRLGLAGLLDG